MWINGYPVLTKIQLKEKIKNGEVHLCKHGKAFWVKKDAESCECDKENTISQETDESIKITPLADTFCSTAGGISLNSDYFVKKYFNS